MSDENSQFSRLLTLGQLHALYTAIGTVLRTKADVENTSYDPKARKNSLLLLDNAGLISSRLGRYSKTGRGGNSNPTIFKRTIAQIILNEHRPYIAGIFRGNLIYDPAKDQYYLRRNDIPYSIAGLMMLLGELGLTESRGTNIYIVDSRLLTHERKHSNKKTRSMITIQQLRDKLIIQERFGEEAEIAAVKFEGELLGVRGITKLPKRISEIDVSAGYDIASYQDVKSDFPDKFIEVKSCADDKYKFYMSRNEIETARANGQQYFLYLYNRGSDKFRIIPDPYSVLFEGEDWAYVPQIYEFRLLK